MMKEVSFFQHLAREWKDFYQDSLIFALSTWLPIIMFVSLWALFSHGLIHDQPVGVVDLDKSSLSRKFITSYDATPVIKVKSYTDYQEALAALHNSEIFGLVVIPKNMAKDTAKMLQPQITALVNYQYLLIGKQINASLRRAHATVAAQLSIGKNLASSAPVLQAAMAKTLPIQVQITSLANINSNYNQFLVSGMVPTAWHLFIIGATIMSLASIKRRFGLDNWLTDGKTPYRKLTARLSILTIIFWLQGALFLWAMVSIAGWPMKGSWPFLLFATLLTVIACQGASCLFFAITCDATRAMSFSAAYSAPAFAFLGVTFPTSDMSIVAQVWRSLLPIIHFSELQIAQSNFGVPPIDNLRQILFLAAYCLFLPLAFYLLVKKNKGDKKV